MLENLHIREGDFVAFAEQKNLETADDSQWSNIKALQGPEWKGRLRKRVGPYRNIFQKIHNRGVVGISASS